MNKNSFLIICELQFENEIFKNPLLCLKFDPLHSFVFFEPGDLLFGIDA